MNIRHIGLVLLFLTGCFTASAQVFTGINPPGTGTNFTVVVDSATTNLSISLPGTDSAYSYILLRKGSPPSDAAYDFSSQVNGTTNSIHLEQPEVSPGLWYVRVRTPLASGEHSFTLTVEGNRTDLRTALRPVTKPLSCAFSGVASNGTYQYFRVELTTSTFWRVALDATNTTSPDLYVARGQIPTNSNFLKRSMGNTNDLLSFTMSEGTAGSYYIGVFGAGAPAGSAAFKMEIAPFVPENLAWDPGLTHLGTQVYTNLSGEAGDYYFRITTANPSLGAWRTALRLLGSNDASLYLSRGVLPTPAVADAKSEKTGSDGVVLGLNAQFLPSEEWFILVRARAGAQWTLVSGTPYVMDLGTVAADASSGSGEVEMGPEGYRFFSATAPADMLAWRLWLNGATNSIMLKKTSVPLVGGNELQQPAQMLVVPSYLSGAQYFIGVMGWPGTMINLDSRSQPVIDLTYGGTASSNVTGFGYTTYRVQVPPQQIAWQIYLPSTNGNPNMAVRRNTVPNENNNDAFSEQLGTALDNITLVPPILSDGTFYITVYSTNAHNFTLQNSPAVVTDINYITTIVNDDPSRVGWRYYRVTDINQQLGSLAWDLYLTNFVPGTRIALRRNSAPGVWTFRNPSPTPANYYDLLSTAEFLQHPAHQADVWYIGVYNPSNALGSFTLVTKELEAAPLAENVPVVRSNVLNGRWEFFKVQLRAEDLQGPDAILGWELRLLNVTSGLPRVVVRREAFPVSLTTTFTTGGTNWLNGGQWAAGADWTKRMYSPDGTTVEDGRILSMGLGRPWEPGTYYVGVINSTGSNNMSYTLLSRWIGINRSIPVQDLNWGGGALTNTVSAREAAYYRVVVPTNTPSWKVKLTTLTGEAMMVAVTNRVPSIDSEKRVQKTGKEHYVMLPTPGSSSLPAGTNYIAVIGEGVAPLGINNIGQGASTYAIESLGPMPEIDLGLLTSTDLVSSGILEGGESIAYRFQMKPESLGFWITLENQIGNPWMVSRWGSRLADPGLGGDTYGNEGGESGNAVASPDIIVASGNSETVTVMVKARQFLGNYPDSSYQLRVKEIIPEPVTFDGGSFTIMEREVEYESFFVIDVPTNAVGWDLRLTNVISGSPLLVVSREALPIFTTSAGFPLTPATSTNWPYGARWAATWDWTERLFSPTGMYEGGRILAMGMGRPLEPGRYYVGVIGAGFGTVNCTLVSRGIGPDLALPVTDLAFAGGEAIATDIPVREANYYRVYVPSNVPSWKVHLTVTTGEAMLACLKDTVPNVGAMLNTTITNSGGRKMQRAGDEHFVLLPSPGQTNLTPGWYYLAVVAEGEGITNITRIGTGTSSYTLTSLGEAPITYLGDVGLVDRVDTNTLGGGEVRIYQFNVPAGTQNIGALLENRTGNPTMALWVGPRSPEPGATTAMLPADPYGNEGGESPGNNVSPTSLVVSTPTNGIYTLIVKARAIQGVIGGISNATYTLRLNASGTMPMDFEGGSVAVASQAPSSWRYFKVAVPTNAAGWDVRLQDVIGLPKIVVRRESVPNVLSTTPWGMPGTVNNWPTNYQWAPAGDWTKRSMSADGTINEDGRIMAAGLNRPLEAGTYYVGVFNTASSNASYTILSRGIGSGFSIPLVDLPLVGSVTNLSLSARSAAYYKVIIPSNTVSWKVQLSGIMGESMLAVLRNSLPNTDTMNSSGNITSGKGMQKLGNEHFVLLPAQGQSYIVPGTNYLAVIGEGVNPGNTSRIGPGESSYVLTSGVVPITDLGMLTSEDLVYPGAAQGGESKAYQFTVPWSTYGVRVRLENRVNNPVAVGVAGDRLPDPGASVAGVPDSYGNEGGQTIIDGHPTVVTLPNAVNGIYTVMVKARALSSAWPDASYTLRVQEILVPELNLSSEQNTNGLSNEISGLLQDNERAFFKFVIPATNSGQPVIGWKLDLVQSSGLASMRVRKDVLPADANNSYQMAFTTASAIIAPPYLSNGVWFVEVKASGSTAFTLKSSALTLERLAWVMPAPGEASQTPGVSLPYFGDTGIDTNGVALGGDQSIFLEQGFLHYYAVEIPGTNNGLLRAQLEAISGNPDLYLRVGSVPTLYHTISGSAGTLYERSMLASSGTEYANWVPLNGKLETQFKPGLWYMAVRAAGNANARYRLRVSVGSITDLPIHSTGLTNQIVAGGDWRYYRVTMPSALPLSFSVTFGQDSGDVFMYLRDTVPAGNGANGTEYKDWSSDQKNFGPYPSYDLPGTYSFNTPPVRPGEAFYIGFRALSDSVFNVRVTTNGTPAQEPTVVAFYGGTAFTNLAAYSAAIFRVDVPPEATRWRHTSTHATNLIVYLDQGSIPTRTGNRWVGSYANSSYSYSLVVWNDPLKQYGPNYWPWVPGQSYFLLVTNVTDANQDFSLTMDGKNSVTEDNDADAIADAWELLYFGNLSQAAGADPDQDGISNFDEYLEGTNPKDDNSFRARLFVMAVNGSVQRQPELASYPLDSTVVLTPVPAAGYTFVGWSGELTGVSNPLNLTMDSHKSLTARFKLIGDDFATAIPISGAAAAINASNVGYTKEPGEPYHAGNPGGKSIWWRWTAPANGPVRICTAGTPFTTLVAVYTGSSVSSLSCVGSDINSTGGTNRSVVNFNATAGVTYNIVVDGYNGASSRIVMDLTSSSVVVRPQLIPLPNTAQNEGQFGLQAEPNRTYAVEFTEDFRTWSPLPAVTTSGTGTATFVDPTSIGFNKRFYRVSLP